MSNNPPNDHFLEKAKALLDSVKGKPLRLKERSKQAIELASYLLLDAQKKSLSVQQKKWKLFTRHLQNSNFRSLALNLADVSFRSKSSKRIADQVSFLLHLGIPSCLRLPHKIFFTSFRLLSTLFPNLFVPSLLLFLKKQSLQLFSLVDSEGLSSWATKKAQEGSLLNIFHLSENILGEKEGINWLQIYLKDLENPKIQYISVKISSLGIPFFPENHTSCFENLAEKLRSLYRAAIAHPIEQKDGSKQNKFIMLDMENYSSTRLIVDLFKYVLSEKEFLCLSAGISLQSYLPESYQVQQELTSWAKERLKEGGAPIKICLVKGAYLGGEQIEASKNDWPQAPFTNKAETDANFKRMSMYGTIAENARAVHLGIATHNIFDIAFVLLLTSENETFPYVNFEMLSGRVDRIRETIRNLTHKNILLYTPLISSFQYPELFNYIIRRIDETTGPDNFLRIVYEVKPSNRLWEEQESLFLQSCEEIERLPFSPRRKQSRLFPDEEKEMPSSIFHNDPKTDFSLNTNHQWAEEILSKWKNPSLAPIPYNVGNHFFFEPADGIGFDPFHPHKALYHFAIADQKSLLKAISIAQETENSWQQTPIEKRNFLMSELIKKLKERRGDLIGSLMLTSGKTIREADREICNAIDTVEYYKKRLDRIIRIKDLSWKPKGTILVMTSWRDPYSLAIGHIAAALLTGNTVLFKPAFDTILTGWLTASIFWDAGVPKEALQFLIASNEDSSQTLIPDKRISSIILSGQFSTARKILELHPGIDLIAHTNGKNALIVSALSDRSQAVEHVIASAFSFSGQKYASASLAILEEEVYEDTAFLRMLRESASYLKVGSVFDLSTQMGPLVHRPNPELMHCLKHLEKGEEWLLEPKEDPNNPHLWSPGIKMGVTVSSPSYKCNEPGPLLSLMKVKNLSDAIQIINQNAFGLTSGLESLDPREQFLYLSQIETGNCTINRSITIPVTFRDPFGGCKNSSFGSGFKIGGPNFIFNCISMNQVSLPKEKKPINEAVNNLTSFIERIDLTAEELGCWYASVANYSYWWNRMKQKRDPSKILGQDNFFGYVPRKNVYLRIEEHSPPLAILLVCAAALTCECPLNISADSTKDKEISWQDLPSLLHVTDETTKSFIKKLASGDIQRLRMVEKAPFPFLQAAAKSGCYIIDSAPLSNGRAELLHYVREVSISYDYHRYGSLGMREGELRKLSY